MGIRERVVVALGHEQLREPRRESEVGQICG